MAKITIAEVREWVKITTGAFDYKQILDGKVDPDARDYLRKIMHDLCKEGTARPVKAKGDGWFKYVDKEVELLLWREADPTKVIPLKFPFGLEKYAKIFPKNIIVIAGSKSAGKTAFILNFIRMNMEKYLIKLFNSEMGGEEFNLRIRNFDGVSLDDWNFEAYERTSDFADVIDPNCVNIIDFLEIHDNFYLIGQLIKEIFDKLENGIALINIQKNLNADFPLGGQRALEKARLVINLDPNKLILKEVKNWADDLTESPRGKAWTFQLVKGAKFLNIQPYHGD